MKTFIIKLKYKNKVYLIKDVWKKHYGWDTALEGVTFMYEDGNFSCDCNKSIFIKEQCDPKFKKMDCGNEIKLLSIKELV